jgi:hypothetical protein
LLAVPEPEMYPVTPPKSIAAPSVYCSQLSSGV